MNYLKKYICLLPILACCAFAGTASAKTEVKAPAEEIKEVHSKQDLKAITDVQRLIEYAAALSGPFESPISSGVMREVVGISEAVRLEFDAISPTKMGAIGPLPKYEDLPKEKYEETAKAVAQNLYYFLGFRDSFTLPAVKRIADQAKAMTPALNTEALRLAAIDPAAVTAKAREKSKAQVLEAQALQEEADIFMAGAELILALDAYKKEKGTFPKSLEEIAPGYIAAIPAWTLGKHPASAKVLNEKSAKKKPASAVTDAGGWLYFSAPGSKFFGKVRPNCSHKDSEGRPMYELGTGK